LCPSRTNITENELIKELNILFGEDRSKKILNLYKINEYENPLRAFTDILSDYFFKCPNLEYAKLFSNYTDISLFFYSFEYHSSGFSNNCNRVSHAYDLPFFFPRFAKYFFKGYELNLNDYRFSNKIVNLWVNFLIFNFLV
jgi:carboxylesterase type B